MLLKGRIIKGIAGFYYVNTEEGIIECQGKGILRQKNIKPLPGDYAKIEITGTKNTRFKTGVITEILPRKNSLKRPLAANLDQEMFIISCHLPEPSMSVIDKFLINAEIEGISSIIVFNKSDLKRGDENIMDIYRASGEKVLEISALKDPDSARNSLMPFLKDKTTVFSGPSGAGKSSIINLLTGSRMETGSLSEKTGRGKNTTRHSELMYLPEGGVVIDTPGFTSLDTLEASWNIKNYYREFKGLECFFKDCMHINEHDCGVIRAVSEGKISRERYSEYKKLYLELKEKEENNEKYFGALNTRR